jgi:hypothetical protein
VSKGSPPLLKVRHTHTHSAEQEKYYITNVLKKP